MYREAVIVSVPMLVAIRKKFKTSRIIAPTKEHSTETTRHGRHMDLSMIEAQLRFTLGGLDVVVLKSGKAADTGKLAAENV